MANRDSRFVLLLAGALAAGCASAPRIEENEAGSITYERALDLRAFGFRRSYRVHLPPAHEGRAALPLVVAVHGAFSSPDHFAAVTGFDRVADEAGFVVAYPRALAPPFRHWNSGHCCGPVRALGIDDVGFLDAVIDDARAHLGIDPGRVFLVGHSNGGMLVHRFVAERPGRVAAAAVVAGTIGGRPSGDEPVWRVPAPGRSVPMLVLHGREDVRVNYAGGADSRSGSGRTWLSASESARFWSRHSGCDTEPRRDSRRDGGLTREIWDSAPGCRVEFHTLEGWGHGWPGRPATSILARDHPLHRFDGSLEVWGFFAEVPALAAPPTVASSQ